VGNAGNVWELLFEHRAWMDESFWNGTFPVQELFEGAAQTIEADDAGPPFRYILVFLFVFYCHLGIYNEVFI
jgi:hypothetical protein